MPIDAIEQAAIINARLDLYEFSRYIFFKRKGYKWQRAAHHKIICDALMRVYRGESKRLILNLPPRYSKTQLVMDFVAWTLGHAPDSEYIHASYSATLAVSNSANLRNVIIHDAYRAIFPSVTLDSDAKAYWTTTEGGVMYATGAGGTITGFGAGKHRDGWAGCIILDDPHKADEARSDHVRNGVINWYLNTLQSRTNSPDTPIILIMQRLHDRDLTGFLLNNGTGEQWDHVCVPAINPDGTALWPEKHNIETLRMMQTASPYDFSGQYMQAPSLEKGNIFKPDAIPMIEAIPHNTEFCRAWDLASSIHGDWTVGVKMGKMPDGRFVIADVVRMRGLPDEVNATLINTAARDGLECKIRLPQDPGQAGKSQTLHITKALAGFIVHSKPVTGDKETRAKPCAAQLNVGNVLMVRAGWNDLFMNEMRSFPSGIWDDQIDALSDAFDELAVSLAGAGMFAYMEEMYGGLQSGDN